MGKVNKRVGVADISLAVYVKGAAHWQDHILL